MKGSSSVLKGSGRAQYKPAPTSCSHHHQVGLGTSRRRDSTRPLETQQWKWWPSWHELQAHYLHELGFLASFTLAIGCLIFWVSGLLALPGIYNHLSQAVLWGLYWPAYLVGGTLFVVSSGLYIIESQEKWYRPAPHALGWWIGVWNMTGSVGWTLSAGYGFCTASWCSYQSALSLLWASLAFLIGSLLTWYEALGKYPMLTDKRLLG
ncbi:hypothetical protein B0A50_01184 [Salinomyces thailandicus]|uniref:Uncharacterized protein n=1 Tax=Salinomyces thailandicus TaxID=706561 RepID=A0A4U0UC34_9PEZI|nr:hypothetical protein B0A50_01184 [Salinomyces thailandica]